MSDPTKVWPTFVLRSGQPQDARLLDVETIEQVIEACRATKTPAILFEGRSREAATLLGSVDARGEFRRWKGNE
jgi:hypothetical protein